MDTRAPEVLLYGSAERLERLAGHPVLTLKPLLLSHDEPLPEFLGGLDVVIDLDFDRYSELGERLHEVQKATLLLSAVEHSLVRTLSAVADPPPLGEMAGRCFGLNALPGFVELATWEVSLLPGATELQARERLKALPFDCQFVQDQVGMVTPRVICRIIAEAYLLVEEGLATREDVELAMRLGVNYPRGPFAWAEHIGPETVVRVLRSLADAYGAEAYQVPRSLEFAARA